jgi:hypothetical protein
MPCDPFCIIMLGGVMLNVIMLRSRVNSPARAKNYLTGTSTLAYFVAVTMTKRVFLKC